MKNLHVLPTDCPSRLRYNIKTKIWELDEFPKYHTDIKSTHNIYITSEEEIKEGDWVLVGYVLRHPDTKNRFNGDINPIKKLVKKGDLWKFTDGTNLYGSTCKKIILTTDPDLIKDKVLIIPDEFLEWFVKNPSCEEIGIKHITKEYVDDQDAYGYDVNYYTIITPKEESKTNLEKLQFPELVEELTKYYKKVPLVEKPVNLSQETLEEAAYVVYMSGLFSTEEVFKQGVNWHQKRSYSKEEVLFQLNLLYSMKNSTLDTFTDEKDMITMKWFEQFKCE